MTDDSTDKSSLQPAPYRPVSPVQCYLAYAAALAAGIAAWRFLENPLWAGLAVSACATIVIWIFSILNNNSSIYDPYWVIAPPLLALALKAGGDGTLFGAWHWRQIIIIACLILWAARYHIFYAWSGWRTGLVKEDWRRYEAMRSAPLPYWLNSLLGMHLFPTVLVYLAFTPAAFIMVSNPVSLAAIGLWVIIGTACALAAVTIDLTADRQLAEYRSSADYTKGGTFRGGMLLRHPLLVFIGPVMMAAFFRFSARLMDMRSLERRPGYQKVMDETSALVPCFSKNQKGGSYRSAESAGEN